MASGISVLVADDDTMNRLTLIALLEHEGYRTRAVEDGSQALAALEEERFDALLLDILMPGIDGFGVLEAVKSDHRLWRIPVIVISAVEETDSIVRCLDLGAEDFVSKPFDPAILRARINAVLARKRFRDLEAEYHKIVEAQAEELETLHRRFDAAETSPPAAAVRQSGVAACYGLAGFVVREYAASPDAVLDVTNAFASLVSRLASHHGAVLAPISGPSVTAWFASDSRVEPTVQALSMLAVLRQEVAEPLTGWAERLGGPLACSAGVAIGSATIGRLAAGPGQGTMLFGEAVHRASELCNSAAGGTLLDAQAAAAIAGVVPVEAIGEAFRVIEEARSP